MKQVKMNVLEFDGYAITVELETDNLNDYAKNFLHIFNNARENKELLKVENHFGSNDVTAYCEEKYKERVTKYLKQFGKIKYCEKVLMYQLEEPDYDLDKYYDAVVIPYFD